MKDKLPVFPTPSDARERLVDRIGSDFYALDQQITTGLQVLLELHNVAPVTRLAVREYMVDVVKNLAQMEAGVVRLADAPGAAEAGYGVKATLSPALSALFEEIRQDEAAGKRGDAHGKDTLQQLLGQKTEAPQPEPSKEHDHEIER